MELRENFWKFHLVRLVFSRWRWLFICCSGPNSFGCYLQLILGTDDEISVFEGTRRIPSFLLLFEVRILWKIKTIEKSEEKLKSFIRFLLAKATLIQFFPIDLHSMFQCEWFNPGAFCKNSNNTHQHRVKIYLTAETKNRFNFEHYCLCFQYSVLHSQCS